jgi:protein-S-isoprenylcysteine O-methyltransferase Ste14
MITPFIAKAIWLVGGIAWFFVRLPHERRARKVPIARRAGGTRDKILLGCSLTGLAIIPFLYVVTGEPRFAERAFIPWIAWLGVLLILVALYLFYETHRQLGKYWSVTLNTRKKHKLIDSGIYSRIRHPMYTAFWLLALSQAALLPNWIGGFSGIVGWGILYFLRVGREERLMLDTFGEEYREYMRRTRRVIPWVY